MNRERSELEFNHYDRPQQAWICGHSRFGTPCPLGPSRLGLCQQTSDCEPQFQNDRWVCNRSQQNGGTCETGPDCNGECSHVRTPCVPSRSLRKRRGVFVFCCLALTLGISFYTLFTPWRLEVLAPGGLSRNHAQILSRNTHDNRCVECHEAGELTLFDLIATRFENSLHSQGTQSQKCLTCHDKSFDSRFALLSHSLAPQQLARLTAQKRSSPSHHSTLLVSHGEKADQIACATCHREHHGADHNLAHVTDKQCAVCHSKGFDSFPMHPEFRNWPHYQDEQIKFDHTSHKFKHFAKGGKTFQCSDCHSLSSTHEIVVATGFESCKSCHDEKITTSLDGVVFFALPMIDVDMLADEGIDVPDWPEFAQGDFDGVVPPLMRLMLWDNESLRPYLELLDDDWDFANLDPDDPDDLQAAGKIAEAMRELLATLSANGGTGKALVRRLFETDSPAVVDSFLAPFVFQTAQAHWFADQESVGEIEDSVDDDSPAPIDEPPKADTEADDDLLSFAEKPRPLNSSSAEPESVMVRQADYQQLDQTLQATGWFRDDEAFTIGYRPQKHADELMTQLLSHLAKASPSESLKAFCFQQLGAPTAAGQCISCHAVQKNKGGTFLRWNADEVSERGFNKFSHSPHLLQPQLRDCSHCHELSTRSGSHRLVGNKSDFRPITKQQCSTCHNKKAAGDNCTKCHNYHVHSFESSRNTPAP